MLDKNVTIYYKEVNSNKFGNATIPKSQYRFFIKNNRYYFDHNGTLFEHHCTVGPAYADLHRDVYYWHQHGYYHRIDGPAYLAVDSIMLNRYYVFGHEVDEKILMNNQGYFTRLNEYLCNSPEEWPGLKGMFESPKRLMKCIKEDKICVKLGKTGNTYRYYALKDRLSIAGNEDDVIFTITGDNNKNFNKNFLLDAANDSVGIGTIAPESYIPLRSDEQKSVQTKDDDTEVDWGVPLTMLALFGAFKVAQGKLSKSSNKPKKSSMAKKTEVFNEKWA